MHTMARGTAALGAAIAMAVAAPQAGAQSITYTATLTGAQEAPPVATPATGTGTFVWNQAANTFSVNLTWSGLLAPTGGPMPPGHIHVAPPGVAGPVVLPFVNFPVGVTSGSYSNTFNLLDLTADARATLATALTTLSAGGVTNAYANIHTTQFPGGEIRGQLAVVPEPATVGLVLTGLVGVGAGALRRRRTR